MNTALTSLTPEQRSLLQAELQARHQQLERQVAAHQAGQSRVDYAAELLRQDSNDAQQHGADREVELERADRERQELGLVNLALARVHQPEYGLCTDCGESIAVARLKLEPWALRCVACESAREGSVARHSL